MDDVSKAEALHRIIAYDREFQLTLERVAADALSCDSMLAAAEFASLYMPAERVCGAKAADECGLSVEQGVYAFVLISAAALADRRQRTIWGRVRTKFAPTAGTEDSRHIAMVNQASRLLADEPSRDKMAAFANLYAKLLEQYSN
jgi:hypothetical protein